MSVLDPHGLAGPWSSSARAPSRPLPRVDVQPATPRLLGLLLQGHEFFEEAVGVRVPTGFGSFGDLLGQALARVEAGTPAHWSAHLFVDPSRRTLVGLGGFVHPPIAGSTEIAYAVVPECRGVGYATAAAAQLVSYATAAGLHTVCAHTDSPRSPAAGVLERLGFLRTRHLIDSERGTVWRWERPLFVRDQQQPAMDERLRVPPPRRRTG